MEVAAEHTTSAAEQKEVERRDAGCECGRMRGGSTFRKDGCTVSS